MKIDISKLSESREIVFFEEWSGTARDLNVPGWKYRDRLKVEVFVRKDSGLVKARIRLRAPLLLTCSRCGKDFQSSLDRSFDLAYAIDLSEKIVEIDGDIREELILSYPQRILCDENCRGLCPRCGVDLNEEKCKCSV